jgi:hypothetical protein
MIFITFSEASPSSNRLLPIIAQFLVLGILNVSHSTFHPQYRLNPANQMRYIEYELLLLPSPPKFKESRNLSAGSGIGNLGVDDLSNLESKLHEQHGIERYPDALCKEARTGTQGVSSSAWFPTINTPGVKYESSSEVGSNAWIFRDACVDSG